MKNQVKLSKSFFVQTLIAIVAGFAVALLFGPKVSFLGVVAKAVIVVIKTFATPLLFLAIIDSVLAAQFRGKGIFWMMGISAINGTFAVAIALFILNVFQPGRILALSPPVGGTKVLGEKGTDWGQALLAQLPDSLVTPFGSHTLPAVIILALLFGFAIRSVEKHGELPAEVFTRLREGIALGLRIHMKILHWIVAVAPLAIFAAVAKAVSEKGLALLPGLGMYVVVCTGGMAIQVFFVYQTWIRFIGKRRLKDFWKAAKDPVLYSFGVNSSLATLPLSLTALDKLKVSPSSARLSACVGTNLNNDGILLYEVVAALFLAQAYGIHLGVWEQVALAGVSVFATVGVAGVPDAGLIALALVLTTVGLPDESLPILLSVDWIVARCRSMVNVVSDLTVAIGIDAMEGYKPEGQNS